MVQKYIKKTKSSLVLAMPCSNSIIIYYSKNTDIIIDLWLLFVLLESQLTMYRIGMYLYLTYCSSNPSNYNNDKSWCVGLILWTSLERQMQQKNNANKSSDKVQMV